MRLTPGQVKVKVTLWLAVSQSVSLSVEPHLGLMIRYLLLFDSYGLVFVGRPLWREDGSAFCICSWPLPAQSFSGPSPLGLATIFNYLRFETSLFVASYYSQGHGGSIRLRLYTGDSLLAVEIHVLTDLCGPKIWHLVARLMFQSKRFGYPRDAQQLTCASMCCVLPCLKGTRWVGNVGIRNRLLHSNVNLSQ
jgi:hypothetical protein